MRNFSNRQSISQRKKAPVEQHTSAGHKGTSISPPNNTGLPDTLKTGIEALSGMSLDDVRVHANSSKPAQLNALAYAQGTDIHLGPGQEQHLPHEAWHVVQQKQGRVRPTMQMKQGVQVNDEGHLEREASVMGAMANRKQSIQHKSNCGCGICGGKSSNADKLTPSFNRIASNTSAPVAQLANCGHAAHAHLAVCPEEKLLVPLKSKKKKDEKYTLPVGDELKAILHVIRSSRTLSAAATAEPTTESVERIPALDDSVSARDVWGQTARYTRKYTNQETKSHPPHGTNFSTDRSIKEILDNIIDALTTDARKTEVEAAMQVTWPTYRRN